MSASMPPFSEIVEEDEEYLSDDAETVIERLPPDPITGPGLFSPRSSAAVDDFLTDEDGASILSNTTEGLPDTAAVAPATSSFSRLSSQVFGTSTTAIDTVIPHFHSPTTTRIFSLARFCELIDECTSLERSTIMSAECYRERSRFGVLHRALVLRLQRDNRNDVWLRLDRRIRKSNAAVVAAPLFVLRGGKAEADDVARIAAHKSDVLDPLVSKLESRIDLESPPSLGIFRLCLGVICEELSEYSLWPENCWFFCSLLQEQLVKFGHGLVKLGRHLYQDLAVPVRSLVNERLREAVPEPALTSSLLSPLVKIDILIRIKDLLSHEKSDTMLDHTVSIPFERLEALALRVHQACRDLAGLASDINAQRSSRLLAQYALSLEHRLYQRAPEHGAKRVALAVHVHGWEQLRRIHAPMLLSQTAIFRELYELDSLVHWRDYASELVRLTRASSDSSASSTRLSIEEARRVLARHSESPALWLDIRILKGHPKLVFSVAFSPDNRRIASGSKDHTVRLWDAMTGESVGEPLKGHLGDVNCVVFSPDGKVLASSSDDRTIQLWDSSTGERMGGPMTGHSDWVWSIAFSPDGRLLVSGSADLSVRLWNASTGESVGEPLRGHSGAIRSVSFSPDGKRIASGSADNTIRLWDAITGEAVGEPLRGHTDWVRSVCWVPDENMLVSGSWDRTVRRWDARTGEGIGEPLEGHTSRVMDVAVSPDGKQIVSCSDDQTMRLWDVLTGESVTEPLRGHTGWIYSVAFSPDGRQIVSGGEDSTVRVWDSLEHLY